jgi:hypothetical protein
MKEKKLMNGMDAKGYDVEIICESDRGGKHRRARGST